MEEPNNLKKHKGRLCAGFEKNDHYLLLVFQDFESEQPEDYLLQCHHQIELKNFVGNYGYNIISENFLRMLQFLCRQLREKILIDVENKKIILLKDLNEIFILTPEGEEWPAKFVHLDNNMSTMERHYEETDEEYLEKCNKEIEENKDIIIVCPFERKAYKNILGYLFAYIVRSEHILVYNFKYLQRVKYRRIFCVDYKHTFKISSMIKEVGPYMKAPVAQEALKNLSENLSSRWSIDR